MAEIMTGLKLAGIDPGILRELSGIYKPFAKAFKELVSNAYDADADVVRMRLSNEYSELEIHDNGIGMTPFELQMEFTKLGGSQKRLGAIATEKGRRTIGSKGIGFLAVARYCSGMQILSTTTRGHVGIVRCRPKRDQIDLRRSFNIPVQRSLLAKRLKIMSLTEISASKRTRWQTKDYTLDSQGRVHLRKRLRDAQVQLEVKYVLDCSGLEFKATLDYDYLLSLENEKDLSEINDFCKLEIYALDKKDARARQHYTRITLTGLKDFVVRELKAARRTGRVRNIESHSGLDHFIWQLRRCMPIRYELPTSIREQFDEGNLGSPDLKSIDRVVFSGPGCEPVDLTRPVWGTDSGPDTRIADPVALPVDIDQDGLKARGYILGHSEAIFPAEYRGIAVRVRNVQIGPPSFFGLEETLSGPAKSILSQITGEINVLEGLDAVDALNPGRDSFYEENPHYKILRSGVAGDGERQSGLLGRVISEIAGRAQVLSAVQSQIARANQNRNTLLNLSLAINHYGMNGGRALKQFLLDGSHCSNGLSERQDFEKLPGPRVAGFRVTTIQDLGQGQLIDFDNRTVGFDFKHDRWSDHVFFLGMHYRVIPKLGSEADPLCEIDTREKKIYVNWGHPLRQQMGDSAFLKSSVAWKLAYHACGQNIESIMDLALKILTFNGA
jgi:hypothetical protein